MKITGLLNSVLYSINTNRMFQGERDSPLHVPRFIREIVREPRRERGQFDTNRERLIWEGEKEREIDPFESEEQGSRIKEQGSG